MSINARYNRNVRRLLAIRQSWEDDHLQEREVGPLRLLWQYHRSPAMIQRTSQKICQYSWQVHSQIYQTFMSSSCLLQVACESQVHSVQRDHIVTRLLVICGWDLIATCYQVIVKPVFLIRDFLCRHVMSMSLCCHILARKWYSCPSKAGGAAAGCI